MRWFLSRIVRWKQWRAVIYARERSWRLYDIVADPAENNDLALKHPEILQSMLDRYEAWMAEMEPPVPAVVPPAEFREGTRNGRHPRRPYGRGWMTVEKWEEVKHDHSQWNEADVRRRMLEEKGNGEPAGDG